MHATSACSLAMTLLAAAATPAEPFEPPAGCHLVAEDNCGELDAMPHVVRGKEYLYPTHQVPEPYDYRTIIFDNAFCLLRYKRPNPQAAYKVDVAYVSQKEAKRVHTTHVSAWNKVQVLIMVFIPALGVLICSRWHFSSQ